MTPIKPKLLWAYLQWLVLCISAIVFFSAGGARVLRASNDFVPVYTGARCLLYGCNPYDPSELEQQFYQAGGRADELPSWDIDVPVYPPSTFLALSPLGLLRYPAARMVWFLLNGCLFVTAAVLMISLTGRSQRWYATILASIVLVTSGILLILGQPACFAISLAVIGCYLFLRGRLLVLGTLLLILSLAVKPQIGGLLVVYLLLQRVQWRYATMVLVGALAVLLGGGFALHQHPRSVGWASTLRANLSSTLSPGGSADPRPGNQQSVGDINLQAMTSIFYAEAHTFNLAAYAIFLLLLAAWILTMAATTTVGDRHVLALSALAILSLLPVYHRFYDSRLLLLTIPAVSLVFKRRRVLGIWMGALTVLAMVSAQYRVQAYLLQHGEFEQLLHHKRLFLLLLRQQNLELVLLFCLYLVAMSTIRDQRPSAYASQAAHEAAVVMS